MKKKFAAISKYFQGYSFLQLLIVLAILTCTCFLVAYREKLLVNAEHFLKNHRNYLIYLVPSAIVLGFYHAAKGNAKEHSLYIFKFLGPILASPLTCLTYAVVINSSVALIYLICYDETTIQKYDLIDKTTLSYTLLLLITWSAVGIVKIFIDCIIFHKPKNEGEIIDDDKNEEEN